MLLGMDTPEQVLETGELDGGSGIGVQLFSFATARDDPVVILLLLLLLLS